MIEVKTITLNINGHEVTLSLSDLRELRNQIDQILQPEPADSMELLRKLIEEQKQQPQPQQIMPYYVPMPTPRPDRLPRPWESPFFCEDLHKRAIC